MPIFSDLDVNDALSVDGSTTDTADDPVVASPGANKTICVYGIQFANTAGAATGVAIKDDASTLKTLSSGQNGAQYRWDPKAPFVVGANKPLEVAALTATTTLFYNFDYFIKDI